MKVEKKQYHHGDLRVALIEIAASIIAEEGVDKVTMRTLSQKAGVSRAAPYRHFPDKTTLLCAVAADGFKKLENQLKIATKTCSGNAASLCIEGIAMAYVDFAVTNPSYYRMMFGREDLMKSPTPELQSNARAAFTVLQEVIQKWKQSTSPVNVEAISITNVLWSTVHGLSMLLIDRQVQHGETVTGIHPLLSDKNSLPAKDVHKQVKLTINTIINGLKNQSPAQ